MRWIGLEMMVVDGFNRSRIFISEAFGGRIDDCAYDFAYDFSSSHLILFIALIFALCLWASFLDIYI
jgi:hypothetical protein